MYFRNGLDALQDLNAAQRWASAMFFLGLFGTSTLIVLGLVYVRSRVERKAGKRYAFFQYPDSRRDTWVGSFQVVSTVGLLLFICYLVLFPQTRNRLGVGIMHLLPLAGLFIATGSFLVRRLWWRIHVLSFDVREEGLIRGAFSFLPWSYMSGFTWNQRTGELMFRFSEGYFELRVDQTRRKEIEQALERFLPLETQEAVFVKDVARPFRRV